MEHDSPVLARVRELVTPVASDLGLDVYDIEHRGGTLRITLDTPADQTGGVTLDDLALASRLVSRQLDEHDPMPGRYTLEVTSPGVERSLRTPEHYRRELGKVVNVRLRDVAAEERRLNGTLTAADDHGVTVDVPGLGVRTVAYDQIDRARTVFEWGANPKPGGRKQGGPKPGARTSGSPAPATTPTDQEKEQRS